MTLVESVHRVDGYNSTGMVIIITKNVVRAMVPLLWSLLRILPKYKELQIEGASYA